MAQLLQNCDLPPPLKVVYISDEIGERDDLTVTMKPSSSPEQDNLRGEQPDDLKLDTSANLRTNNEIGLESGASTEAAILRAMHLSQSRAREAQDKATSLRERCKKMSTLLMEEAIQNYAYRQWVKLLEIEVSMLRKHDSKLSATRQQTPPSIWDDDDDDDDHHDPNMIWYIALHLVLGLAGVGLAVGYRYLLFW